MSKFQKILDSFSIKDTLNPKIWENPKEPDNAVMIPKVRKALMRIAEEFIKKTISSLSCFIFRRHKVFNFVKLSNL